MQLPSQPPPPPAGAGLTGCGPTTAAPSQSDDSGTLPDEDGDVALLLADGHATAGAAQHCAAPWRTLTVLCDYHVVYHPSYRVPVLCLLPRHQGALLDDDLHLVPSVAR